MKKLLSLMLLCTVCLVFTTCGDDEDEPEKFVWNGDWNDPDDPNYKQEGYNPIQGLWRSDYDSTHGLYFSEDFIGYIVYFYPNGGHTKEGPRKYEINDKAYRYSRATPDTHRYKIEGNNLYLYRDFDNDDKFGTYSRVPEN